MILPLIIRPEARDDLIDTRDWYEAQRTGLGGEFADEVAARFDQVRSMPRLFAAVDDDIRACRLGRFPFIVYYRLTTEYVEILAVLHGSRDPSIWRSRS